MSEKEGRADSYFRCTESERAAFEAGIKLATVYHQFVGTPFNMSSVDNLERAIESAVGVQPYVESVKVGIDRDSIPVGDDVFAYSSLTGEMLTIELRMRFKGTRLTAGMRYIPELDYPLMFIKDVESGE